MSNPFDQFDTEQSNPFDQFDEQKPKKEEGWGTRVASDIGERFEKIKTSVPEGLAPFRGERALFRIGGQIAGAANDVIGQTLKSAYKTIVPEKAQRVISEAAGNVMESPYVQEPIKAGAELYGKFKETFPEAAKDVEAGANIAGFLPMGKAAGLVSSGVSKTASLASKPISKVVKEAVGAYTGRGPGFIEEMVKGSEAAEKAMRGQITGEEIVKHAKDALQKVRDTRHSEYLNKLDAVRANPTDLSNVHNGLKSKLGTLSTPDEFDLGISVNKKGVPVVDFSKSTIIEHQNVVKKAVQDVLTWDDTTARGLDNLSKRLGTYVAQSGRGTPAESFVTQLKNEVKSGLKRTVPEYDEMTRGYYEASNLIKDIESNLMLRKEGMTGRITADNTLRRLSSALQEGKEMRKDLLLALGTKSGMEVPSEVAGYLAGQWIPAGILGKGLTMGSAYALHFLNPYWWPVIAASSPRVVGEFLNLFGKARNVVKKNVSLPKLPTISNKQAIAGVPAYALANKNENSSKTLRDFNRVIAEND
jgi:hypothetical protein